jgi:hypothetical protein
MMSTIENNKVCGTLVALGDIQLGGGIQLDTIIVDGWREREEPPSGTTRTWTLVNGNKIAVKLIIAEYFASEMSFVGTVTRTQEKYRPRMAALRKAGWSVALLTHVITQLELEPQYPLEMQMYSRIVGLRKWRTRRTCSRN